MDKCNSIYLINKVKNITGIDLSKKMLRIARNKLKKNKNKRKVILKNDNLLTFKLKKKFNVAYSLFDVICLITKNKDLKKFFYNLSKHLKSKSLVYLDYWYKPAVFFLKIKDITQVYENANYKIIRKKYKKCINQKTMWMLHLNFIFIIKKQIKLFFF